ncbi:hypothetical protein FRB99_000295 [Tulasnella sp. 403]|nr:hypothetical protein FRB99_000295 [Tulasnella sp. 403]
MTTKLSLTDNLQVCAAPALSVLQPAANLAVLICEQVKLMEQNQEKGLDMANRVTTLLRAFSEKMSDDMDQSLPLKDDVARLESTLRYILTGLEQLTKRRHLLVWLFLAQARCESLSRLDASLSEAISLFGVTSLVTIGRSVAKLLPADDDVGVRAVRLDLLTSNVSMARVNRELKLEDTCLYVLTTIYYMTPRRLCLTEALTLASRIAEKLCDVPALSMLRPVAGLAVLICEQVALMKQNKEVGIDIAVRVATILEVLAEKMADDMEQAPSLRDDVARLESTLHQILTGLEKLAKRRRLIWRLFLAQANRESLSRLDASLSEAISLFGVASQITIGKSIAKLLLTGDSSDKRVIRTDLLMTTTTLYRTNSYWRMAGTYNEGARVTNVLIKNERSLSHQEFLEDLEVHKELIHPNIAALWAWDSKTRIILLNASDLVYGSHLQDVEITRQPWELQIRLSRSFPSFRGKSVPLMENRRETPDHPHPANRFQVEEERLANLSPESVENSFVREMLAVKHSSNIKFQLQDVAEFLAGMQFDVAWWQFDPQWVALRNNQLVLLDWVSRSSGAPASLAEAEPDPEYMVHVMGLGFAASLPDLFEEVKREFYSLPQQDRMDLSRQDHRPSTEEDNPSNVVMDESADQPRIVLHANPIPGTPRGISWQLLHDLRRRRRFGLERSNISNSDGSWTSTIRIHFDQATFNPPLTPPLAQDVSQQFTGTGRTRIDATDIAAYNALLALGYPF